jgi:hypothetical protein
MQGVRIGLANVLTACLEGILSGYDYRGPVTNSMIYWPFVIAFFCNAISAFPSLHCALRRA